MAKTGKKAELTGASKDLENESSRGKKGNKCNATKTATKEISSSDQKRVRTRLATGNEEINARFVEGEHVMEMAVSTDEEREFLDEHLSENVEDSDSEIEMDESADRRSVNRAPLN